MTTKKKDTEQQKITIHGVVFPNESRDAAARYFSVWTAQRDAITSLEKSPGALMDALFSIALGSEAAAIAAMSDEELRRIPPIAITRTAKLAYLGGEYDRYAPGDIYVEIIGDPTTYRVLDLCSNAPDVIAALDKLCEYRKNQGGLSGLDFDKAQKAALEQSRAFARVFWDWYERQEHQESADIETGEPRIVVNPQKGMNMAIYSGLMEQAVISSIHNAKFSTQPLLNTKSTRGHTFSQLKQKNKQRKQETTAEVSLLAKNALNLLQEFDDYTTDAILIHFEEWRENRDDNGYAWMTAETMVKSRGNRPKTKKEGSIAYSSGFRPEDYAEAYRRVQQLEDIWLTVYTTDIWSNEKKGNARKKIGEDFYEGRLLVIKGRKKRRIDGKIRIYAWRFGLFEGLEELVKDDCFAYVSRTILGYDYYRQIPEKRIGLYTAIHFKINNMRSILRKVGTLIKSCRLPFDKERQNRFIERLHKALNKLVEDGVLREWNYLVSGKVDKDGQLVGNPKLSKNVGDLGLDARGFWEDYIEKTIWLEPNPDIPKVKRKGDDPKPVTSSPTKPALSV